MNHDGSSETDRHPTDMEREIESSLISFECCGHEWMIPEHDS